MKKIKLYAIGNEKDFNYYIFDKKQYVVEILAKLFGSILGSEWMIYEEYEDKKGKWKTKKINLEKEVDSHEELRKIEGNQRIDIFYGKKEFLLLFIVLKN